MSYQFGGLIFGGAYTWRGLFSEFYGILQKTVVGCPCNQTFTRNEIIIQKPIFLYRSSSPEPLLTKGQICGGDYTWKIERFSELLQGDSDRIKPSLDCPAIYTSLYGYKFFMRIFPKGADGGDGRHIALFVGIMQGEYDNILEWPFSGQISLSIKDQTGDVNGFRHDISGTFMANRNLGAFQKPAATWRYTTLYGYEKFAPIAMVCTPQYSKDDTVMIKIKIHNNI